MQIIFLFLFFRNGLFPLTGMQQRKESRPRQRLVVTDQPQHSPITLTSEEILFGAATDNDSKNKKPNFYLLYAKFYFHFQKINYHDCIWDVFVQKLIYMLKIEGLVYLICRKEK